MRHLAFLMLLLLPLPAFATTYTYEVLPGSGGYLAIYYYFDASFQSKLLDGEMSFVVDDVEQSVTVTADFDRATTSWPDDPLFPLSAANATMVWHYTNEDGVSGFDPQTGALRFLPPPELTELQLDGAPFETLTIRCFSYPETMPTDLGAYLFDFAWSGERDGTIYEFGATTRLAFHGADVPEPASVLLLLAGWPVVRRLRR